MVSAILFEWLAHSLPSETVREPLRSNPNYEAEGSAMSKSSRLQSTHSNYEVGYGRPPVATRFAAGTSGNPRGRPKNAERARADGAPNGLSLQCRAALVVGARKVEFRRGKGRVVVSQHTAVMEGLAEASRHGNVRGVEVFLKYHQEAENNARRKSVDAAQGVELTKYIAALTWGDSAAMQENERLRAQIAELEAAAVAPVVDPNLTEAPVADGDPPSGVPSPAAAAQPRAPEVVRAPQALHATTAPLPRTRRRWDDPVIPRQVLGFGGGYGISGGRQT